MVPLPQAARPKVWAAGKTGVPQRKNAADAPFFGSAAASIDDGAGSAIGCALSERGQRFARIEGITASVAILLLAEFRLALPPDGALLGLDLGTKTIGLAVSDLTRTVATPLATIRRAGLARDLDRLAEVIALRAIAGFVAGLPVDMDGREGRRCQAARQFARDLLRRIDRPLTFWDERLSTAAVERMLTGEADLSRRRRGQVVDSVAAAYILQGALDALAYQAAALVPPRPE